MQNNLMMKMLHTVKDNPIWSKLSVAVDLHEVRGTNVLWINREWFRLQGIDLSCDKIRRKVDKWLIESFSYIVKEPHHPPELFTGRVRSAYVDRYGGRGIGHAGGSGRCAYIDGFYLKGVGPTPLIDPKGPFFKTHGAMPLQEAIREVILSQVACAEFPHGGIPALAILGLKPRFHNGEHDLRGEHRALMLRPAFFRLAHLEPARSFVALKGTGEAIADEARVRSSMEAWSRGRLSNDSACSNSLEKVAGKLGAQLAFARVHRLSNVSYISSNFSTDGELADFGSFRAFPNWEAAIVARGMPAFGQENSIIIRTIIWSMAYQFTDAAKSVDGLKPSSVVSAVKAFQAEFDRTVKAETANLFGVPPDTEIAWTLFELCDAYFSTQNREYRDYHIPAHRVAPVQWLFESRICSDRRKPRTADAAKVSGKLKEIESEIERVLEQSEYATHAMLTIRRTLRPRVDMYTDRLHAWVWNGLVISHDQSWLAKNLCEAVRQKVSSLRRVWPDVDPAFAIRGHSLDADGNSILWLYDAKSRRGKLRVSMTFVDGVVDFFGQKTRAASLSGLAQGANGTQTFDIPVPDGYTGRSSLFSKAGHDIALPRLEQLY